jgi:outer membrane murein-binding lipoprotein Lpp
LNDKPTIPDELADLSDDATHRTVTDTEKSTWNAKQDELTADVDYLTPDTAASTYEPKK